jgi:hypothetical protein
MPGGARYGILLGEYGLRRLRAAEVVTATFYEYLGVLMVLAKIDGVFM